MNMLAVNKTKSVSYQQNKSLSWLCYETFSSPIPNYQENSRITLEFPYPDQIKDKIHVLCPLVNTQNVRSEESVQLFIFVYGFFDG